MICSVVTIATAASALLPSRKAFLYRIQVQKPKHHVISHFSHVTLPNHHSCKANNTQNINLSSLRDCSIYCGILLVLLPTLSRREKAVKTSSDEKALAHLSPHLWSYCATHKQFSILCTAVHASLVILV